MSLKFRLSSECLIFSDNLHPKFIWKILSSHPVGIFTFLKFSQAIMESDKHASSFLKTLELLQPYDVQSSSITSLFLPSSSSRLLEKDVEMSFS